MFSCLQPEGQSHGGLGGWGGGGEGTGHMSLAESHPWAKRKHWEASLSVIIFTSV